MWASSRLSHRIGAALSHAILLVPALLLLFTAPSVAAARFSPPKDPNAVGQWQPMNTAGAPAGRYGHTAVWTGSEMLVWGGYSGAYLNDGDRYNPVTDTWAPITAAGAPGPRLRHSAIWTGSEMIIWGGEPDGSGGATNTGGKYNPATDSWTLTSLANAPSARQMHSAVWTGSEMIVWGGCTTIFCSQVLNDGGRYDPLTDTWTPLRSSARLPPRNFHQAVWTGQKMIVWGGSTARRGAAYPAAGDRWSLISATNSPTPTTILAGAWTGTEMLVWGGCQVFSTGPCTGVVNTGGRYNPSTNSWSRISAVGAPEARYTHTGVWTGQEFIVWGGCGLGPLCFNSGGLYNPATDTWSAVETANAPTPRSYPVAVWTGTEMLVWGGCDLAPCGQVNYFDTGGRFTPATP